MGVKRCSTNNIKTSEINFDSMLLLFAESNAGPLKASQVNVQQLPHSGVWIRMRQERLF